MKADKTPDYPLHSIYFYPTESCNLKCIHCWISPDFAPDPESYSKLNQDAISVEEMERAVIEAIPMGLNNVKLTGGEPFLRHDLFEFLDCFTRHNLSLSFETNGTLLDEDTVSRLKEYDTRQISVSLDGSCAEIHERIRSVKGSFDKTVKGIGLLVEKGIDPQIIFCLQEINAHDLENAIRLAVGLGVKSFEINPVSFLGVNSHGEKGCRSLKVETLLDIETRVEEEFPERYPDIHINLYLPPALKGIRSVTNDGLCTCRVHTICGILSNGDVSICGIGRRRKDLIVGNIKEGSLSAIWREGDLFQDIRLKVPVQLRGICGRCLFKYHCLGFCRAGLLSYSKESLLDPYDMCDEAYRMRLFPESRVLTDQEMSRIKWRQDL